MPREYTYPDIHADEYARTRAQFTATDAEVLAVLNDVALRDTRVLDLGCGDGRHARWFLERGARIVTGVDNSPRMIALAQKHAGLSTAFQVASARALPFAQESFDFVFSYFTLHHILEIQDALSEVHRVLSADGIFLSVFGGFVFKPGIGEPAGEYGPVELQSGETSVTMHTLVRSVEIIRSGFLNAGFRLRAFKSIANADAQMHHTHPYRNAATLATTLAIAEK